MANEDTPAFPISSPSGFPGYLPHRDGMSLRDYFAGQAVISIMLAYQRSCNREQRDALAAAAFELADAMLTERNKANTL